MDRYTWDLSPLYASVVAWEDERQFVIEGLRHVDDLKGTLGRNAASLLTGMNQITDLRQRSANLLEYAILTSNLDVGDAPAAARRSAATALTAQVEAAVTFSDFEILALGESTLERFLHEQPALEAHRLRFHKILNDGPHFLSEESEAVMRGIARWPEAAVQSYEAFFDSRLPWPSVKDATGHTVAIDDASFGRLLTSRDAGIRRTAQSRYLALLRRYQPLFGRLLDNRIDADLTLARMRHYADGVEALLHSEGMPPSAVATLISVARDHRATLRRYEALRARAVGASGSFGDGFVAPPAFAGPFPVAATLDAIVAMVAPLGSDYQAQLKRELATPWLHLPPWPQKRNTYGNWGNNIAGKPSFGFMKYDGSYRSASNLAGLAIGRLDMTMPTDMATDTRVDPGVYGNALVFAGNILHNDYLRARAISRRERLGYLVAGLDRLRQIMFDEAITVELGLDVQQRISAGQTPSGAEISRKYLGLLRDYYASPQLGLSVPDEFAIGWVLDGLPFDSFEDQNFPLAMAAACALTEKVRSGDPVARRGFDGVRGRIGSDLSYDLLKAAGVDLATTAPYEAAMRRMSALLAELETVVAEPP